MSTSGLTVQDYAGVTLVTFVENSLLDAARISQLAKTLYELTDAQARRKLILDLSNVKLLSSHFLGVLTTLHKKAQAIQGVVVLSGVRPDLAKVFTLTGLDALLKMYPTDAAALRSFGVHVE